MKPRHTRRSILLHLGLQHLIVQLDIVDGTDTWEAQSREPRTLPVQQRPADAAEGVRHRVVAVDCRALAPARKLFFAGQPVHVRVFENEVGGEHGRRDFTTVFTGANEDRLDAREGLDRVVRSLHFWDMKVASSLRTRTCRRRRSSWPLLSRKTLRATCSLNRFVRDGKSSNATVAGGRLGMSGLRDCQSDAARLFLYQSIKPFPEHVARRSARRLAHCIEHSRLGTENPSTPTSLE